MSDNIERVPRTEREAAAAYTCLSRWYDRLSRSSEGPHIAEGLRLLNVQPGEHVLEVGFGTGRSLVVLAHRSWINRAGVRNRSGGRNDCGGARATAQRHGTGVIPACSRSGRESSPPTNAIWMPDNSTRA